MGKLSVYQSDEYREALENSGEKVVEIGGNFFAVERSVKTPLGIKRILEARGTPIKADAESFKKISKKYLYGTISPCVLDNGIKILEELKFKRVVNNTILIDLRKDEQELMNNLEKKSARWGVRKAGKNGLKFLEPDKKEDIEEFYRMYEETAREGGFKAESRKFILSLLGTDVAKLFLVKKNERVIAGGMILIDKSNNYAILDLTSSSSEGLKMQAMPFLYWNMMIYSKAQGMDYFDLGGYDKEAERGDKTHNINKFKERFGGNIVEQPIYSTNWKYSLIRNLMKRFKFLKKMYKK